MCIFESIKNEQNFQITQKGKIGQREKMRAGRNTTIKILKMT